ncbi:hypothetical protein AAE478_007843 [Parahypoxylon ruwenzoriense]
MTKQWNLYETKIKSLYAKNTLSAVRQIMLEEYGFRASTRAYRGRLIRWGVRKYNSRKYHNAPSSASSVNDGSSASDPDSPTVLPQGVVEIAPAAQRRVKREASAGGSHLLALPVQMNQQYGSVGEPHNYGADGPYNSSRIKVLLPSPQSGSTIQYGWSSPLTAHNGDETPSDPDSSFSSHAEAVITPPYFGGYAQIPQQPMDSRSPYDAAISIAYEVPDHHDPSGRHGNPGYYRPPTHGHDGTASRMAAADLPYAPSVRDYGHSA